MKILIVCSRTKDRISPFISDQVVALQKEDVIVEYFTIKQKGVFGYLKAFIPLREKIKDFQPDLLHAHYGLSGLFAGLQRVVPVVTTFHGSDINIKSVRYLSRLAYLLSEESIFVSAELKQKLGVKQGLIMPCGVDMDLFVNMPKSKVRKMLGLHDNKRYILFSSSFDNPVKNYELARNSIKLIEDSSIELLEFKGYSRAESATLFNAVDVAFLTSFTEGSPQFIKEAMACNIPIVTVDVGDVRWLLNKTSNSSIVASQSKLLSNALIKALQTEGNNTRSRLIELNLDNKTVACQLCQLYAKIIK